MRDNKAFASLSSGLLARKGQARPAMRPQGYGQGMGHPDDLGWNDMGHDAPVSRMVNPRLPASLSGGQPPHPANAEVPQVVRQQEEIAREFARAVEPEPVEIELVEAVPVVAELPKTHAAKPVKAARRRPARAVAVTSQTAAIVRGGARKAAFTLRLDAERHLRLRLACAVQNRSAQQFVTEALDQLLASLPDVARLAADLSDRHD